MTRRNKSAKKRVGEYLGISTKDFVHDCVTIEITETQWKEWLHTANAQGLSKWLDGAIFEAPQEVVCEVLARLKSLADAG